MQSSGDKLLEFIKQFHKHMQREDCITESCNVISFIEDVRRNKINIKIILSYLSYYFIIKGFLLYTP